MNNKLLEAVVRKASKAYEASSGPKADSILENDNATALSILISAKRHLGPEFLTWEPETFWQMLPICEHNKGKLLAAQSLAVRPTFYFSPRVFGNIVMALCDEVVVAGELACVSCEQMAWAVTEAGLIYGLTEDEDSEPSFEDEVCAYVAVMLHDAGMVLCPPELTFAQDELDLLLDDDGLELQAKVKEAVNNRPKSEDEDGSPSSALGVQLMHLDHSEAYCDSMLRQLQDELEKF